MNIKIDELSHYQIKLLIDHLNFINEELNDLKNKIIFNGTLYFKDDVLLLLTINGFSAFTAIALLTDIVDIKRFKNAKKFTCYLRTTPKIKESNKTTHIGNLNRCGRTLTVTLLTQSLKHFKKSGSYFQEFYTRLRKGKSAGKARLALIRKVLTSVYYILKRKNEFFWKSNLTYDNKVHKLKSVMKTLSKINGEVIKEIA